MGLADLLKVGLGRGGATGLYSGWLLRAFWRIVRGSRQTAAGPFRRWLLTGFGPAFIVLELVLWVLLPIVGFALCYWPAMASGGFRSGGEVVTGGFLEALYFSAYAFTTLGLGPLTPAEAGPRLLAVAESAVGFAVFTLAITYLLGVYGALRRRDAFAMECWHLSGRTSRGAELLARLPGGQADSPEASRVLGRLLGGICELHESHHTHPLLHHFRRRQAFYGMSAVVLLALELVDAGRGQGGDAGESWRASASAGACRDAAEHLVSDLGPRLLGAAAPASGAYALAEALRIQMGFAAASPTGEALSPNQTPVHRSD